MSEEAAVARALEDFGGPEQVRAELEATHGHRVMGVVLDKAMQWQERTMKAKWLWTTWAYLAAVGVIVVELFSIVFTRTFLIPKMHKMKADGMIDLSADASQIATKLLSFLDYLEWFCDRINWWGLVLAAMVWGMFEWRVRSENKPFMRLAALGTAAAGLAVVVALMTGSLSIPFMVGMPAVGRMARTSAPERVTIIDLSIEGLEQAQAKKDWEAMRENANRASQSLDKLAQSGPFLAARQYEVAPEELLAQMKTANDSLHDAVLAINDKDGERLEAALKTFHKAYKPLREAVLKYAK
jgi:hypothetical protein